VAIENVGKQTFRELYYTKTIHTEGPTQKYPNVVVIRLGHGDYGVATGARQTAR
jgi:hypothetical protein